MKETTLVVLAAGMGSRFGGMKQITPIGPNGEIIIDFSVFDAVKAGFSKVVMVIKKEKEKEFREVVGKRIESLVDVRYVYQSLDKIPLGCIIPNERTKPWGTAHAVLCAKEEVNTPFAVINSDDFYGYQSYKLLHDHLISSDEMCLVGFRLGQTLSDYGSVSRGICSVNGGYLSGVEEVKSITQDTDIPLDNLCSMNMWGMQPSVFARLEEKFVKRYNEMEDKSKDEFYLPTFVDNLIRTEGTKVKVITSPEKWFGVTYKEDAPYVKKSMQQLLQQGKYKGMEEND